MSNESSLGLMRIGLATADDIRRWSFGEVKKPETINYRTLKPEKDGLFDERIFGPTKDWECYCGKYKRVRFKGIVCERCGVEVTRSKVRRERMGHIELAAPVTHIWYFKGVPSRLGYLLDLAPKDLEKVIYFAAYMITKVDEEARHEDLPMLQAAHDREKQELEAALNADVNAISREVEAELARIEAEGGKAAEKRKLRDNAERQLASVRKRYEREAEHLDRVWDRFKNLKVADLEGDEALYRSMIDKYGLYFEGAMGAEAIKKRLESFDLEAEAEALKEIIQTGKGQKKTRALKRLKVVNAFLTTNNSPLGMVLDVVPVIPPELRPMVQLDGGRFATSDLNDLYRRVINRNNRLKRLLELGAPEIIVNNEKRMLQEAVDSLFDNGRRGRPVTGPGNRPLKSLSDMLKGKQGRFRQNLLGKRVDYSGRSVIVVGPQLQMHQCGLPKQMALELFKPFVMKRLVELSHAQNIKSAKRMVERFRPQVWDVLEEVIAEHPVLLNRAPTLHRLGIQAFEPKLVEGKAIQLHPLVCSAFNADFDGDQMAVHLPLSPEAQAEARILMLSSNNILKPSDGRPVAVPSQDMIIGLYHLTTPRDGQKNEGHAFSSVSEALMAMDRHEIELYTKVKIRLDGDQFVAPEDWEAPEGYQPGDSVLLDCTVGQVLFNQALPKDYPWFSGVADKKGLGSLINDLAERYPMDVVARALDNLKNSGFYWASRSGVTVAVSDIATPSEKPAIMERYEKQAAAIEDDFEIGTIDDEERRQELIKVWTEATDVVAEAMRENLSSHGGLNTIYRMVTSGARGNWMQVRQIAGIRGLVSNPKGEIMPRPIKSSYREGLSVLEYFIATHGARKGLADTALRTANSGYLTRRLVDVSQDVIVREHDCGTRRGLVLPLIDEDGGLHQDVETSIHGRTLAVDVKDEAGNVLAAAGSDVSDELIEKLFKAGVKDVRVRSVLTCESAIGVCALCYGRSMASNVLVDIGEAVGIIAAQSIGEPGTQLTMRTFHTGGVASADDITQGLPRIQELFEARTPKGVAPISEVSGRVTIEDTEKSYKIVVTPDDGSEPQSYTVLRRAASKLQNGDHVQVGDQLATGSVDPKEVLRIRGPREAQKHLVSEVQGVYKSQGVEIHDKHVEVIVRQMLRRVTVIESGDTDLLPGELVDNIAFQTANRKALAEGKKPAAGRPEMMGITKASLATESWLSAASFQETTRVLTQAAMEAKTDPLLGLKENVIIGKLVPAGTGLARYNDIEVEPSAQATAERMQALDTFGGYPSAFQMDNEVYTYGNGGFMAVSLDEYGRGLD
ncbi:MULTISPECIES: DNA-directed RNA polymerase subunit beta' [Rothia]|uniref:DNA-directed RNA polymerase subunit beta' n=1 Tax=Rothia TaxID=32207 RepID=UPI00066DC34A|nr:MULTISPECIES: DNA-directed RNA polymerase subunit beta' [Rothia]MDU2570744.1 DNA-directed RNA polymerase subunit beta' [Rothia mucilaginosa]OFL76336.1 DNA-directed RNA polymerase subunit beta' [Rothia sp. HMSC075F09]OFQ74705.1 DNA-directed RNA polymerase subunit beta' [Rothia sp. HMSC068E02]OFR30072.1 DNA-directed RNA polymerase subunit beta' [Rothia sp. HMSC066G02]